MKSNDHNINKVSAGMLLVTIGIVYGDIGTSPMYVMKSILEGNGGISQVGTDFVIGALSLVIWTITLLTTIKYVLIAMKADNNGEGGIFSLYSLVRKTGKWLIVPAMLGGSALLADGVLTPAVTVTTAVEGLRSISVMNRFLGNGQAIVIIITLAIILTLFSVQHAGTSKIGKAFGPVMLIWFSFLAAVGLLSLLKAPFVLKAFNPVYAVKLLFAPYNKSGFMVLGSVFLAATGAEALYSDMGHVGKKNIYVSWIFVKLCLILNYMGQCAWIINNQSNTELYGIADMNPFYLMLPESFRPFAVILGAAAAVIASQALITGSYTLVSEAMNLDLMPHLEIKYPSDTKGQIYIGTVNTILMIGCSCVVLYFRSGARIESAYGLAITLTMLMTTLLLSVYLFKIKNLKILAVLLLVVFGALESVFFFSSLGKFMHGGYVTVVIALLIFIIMIIWYRGSQLEKRYGTSLQTRDYVKNLKRLHEDDRLPYTADNVVFLETRDDTETLYRDILYSILDKDPKRAKAYWFISVKMVDEADVMNYKVETFGTDFIFRVVIYLGFKKEPCINFYLRQIVAELMESGQLPRQETPYSIYGDSGVGSFKFFSITRTVPANSGLSSWDDFILRAKYAIRKRVGSRLNWYGFSNAFTVEEKVPLIVSETGAAEVGKLKRI